LSKQLILEVNELIIPAKLNNSIAARSFAKRLPIDLKGFRSSVDYSCNAPCTVFDPTETQSGWQNGDISLSSGWFAIFFDGQEKSKRNRGLMIIAHIEPEYLQLIKALPETIKIKVKLAE
jgi:hypothetical protein